MYRPRLPSASEVAAAAAGAAVGRPPGQFRPAEFPYLIETAGHPAVITLASIARGVAVGPASASADDQSVGDRLILCSSSDHAAPTYAVYEQHADDDAGWQQVTPDLSGTNQDDWSSYRHRHGQPVPEWFDAWLSQFAPVTGL